MSDISRQEQPQSEVGLHESARSELFPEPASLTAPQSAAALLQEFGHWLQRWANHVQAQMAAQGDAAINNPIMPPVSLVSAAKPSPGQLEETSSVAPPHLAANPEYVSSNPPAKPSSPPAHWLERVQRAAPPPHWQAHIQRAQTTTPQDAPILTIAPETPEAAIPIDLSGFENRTDLGPTSLAESAGAEEERNATKPTPRTDPQPTLPRPARGDAPSSSRPTTPVTLTTMHTWISKLQQGVAAMLEAHKVHPSSPQPVSSPAPHEAEGARQIIPALQEAPAAPLVEPVSQPIARPQVEGAPPVIKLTAPSRAPRQRVETATVGTEVATAVATAVATTPPRQTQLRFNPSQTAPKPAPTEAAPQEALVGTAPKKMDTQAKQRPVNAAPPQPGPWPTLPTAPSAAQPGALDVASADLWPHLPPVSMAEAPTPHPHYTSKLVASGRDERFPASAQATAQETLQRDRWPTLLEETEPTPADSPPSWRQLAYQQARRRRLDREQQGTLWNE